ADLEWKAPKDEVPLLHRFPFRPQEPKRPARVLRTPAVHRSAHVRVPKLCCACSPTLWVIASASVRRCHASFCFSTVGDSASLTAVFTFRSGTGTVRTCALILLTGRGH